MADIKETMELLDGLEVIAVIGAEIFADGKVNFADATKVVELAKNFGTFKAAIDGIDQVDDELKDLSQEELLQLGSKVFEIVKAVRAAGKDA